METNNADKMVKNFFTEYKQEIPDNGFTQRVMRKLPKQSDHGWIVWIFAAIGMSISLYVGLNAGLFQQATLLIQKIPFYYLFAGMFCFPLISCVGFFMNQLKNIRII